MVLNVFTNQSLLNCKVWSKSVTMLGRRLLYLKIYCKQHYDCAIKSFKTLIEIRCYNNELKIRKNNFMMLQSLFLCFCVYA